MKNPHKKSIHSLNCKIKQLENVMENEKISYTREYWNKLDKIDESISKFSDSSKFSSLQEKV